MHNLWHNQKVHTAMHIEDLCLLLFCLNEDCKIDEANKLQNSLVKFTVNMSVSALQNERKFTIRTFPG